MTIGVVSDSHCYIAPGLFERLRECDAILHAGDFTRQSVADKMALLGPAFYAVRGNCDFDLDAGLRRELDFTLGGLRVYMTHKPGDIPQNTACYDLVVCGHTHKFSCERRGGTLFLNPGTCGSLRAGGELTMAIVNVEEGKILSVARRDIHSGEETIVSGSEGRFQ